jgi:hypothetical protein
MCLKQDQSAEASPGAFFAREIADFVCEAICFAREAFSFRAK